MQKGVAPRIALRIMEACPNYASESVTAPLLPNSWSG